MIGTSIIFGLANGNMVGQSEPIQHAVLKSVHLSSEKLSRVPIPLHPAAFSVALVGMNSRSSAQGIISCKGPGTRAAAASTASRLATMTAVPIMLVLASCGTD